MSRQNLGLVEQFDDPALRTARPLDGLSSTHGRTASGVGATIDMELLDRVIVGTGLRIERSGVTSARRQTITLPVAGASFDALHGAVDVTLRAAYGRGLSWPQILHPQDLARLRQGLTPELQTGLEAGVDVGSGPARLQLTRFRQVSSDVMQYVPAHDGSVGSASFTLQNVGGVVSAGWEVGVSGHHGALTAAATMTAIDSRVSFVADAYTGELDIGDRVLGVPGRTIGARVGWNGALWDAALSASRATDWINYDRAALAADADAGNAPAGRELRGYWLRYEGVTHVSASAARRIGSRAVVHLNTANLLDHRLGEPDNVTLVPGRTISAGIRISF
jgi:iron complex outermembrane recepter protein